jgi:hypothetical protein
MPCGGKQRLLFGVVDATGFFVEDDGGYLWSAHNQPLSNRFWIA